MSKKKLIPKHYNFSTEENPILAEHQTFWEPVYKDVNPFITDENQETLQALARATEGYRNGKYEQQEKEQSAKNFRESMMRAAIASNPQLAGTEELATLKDEALLNGDVDTFKDLTKKETVGTIGGAALAATPFMIADAATMGLPWWKNFIGEAATGMAGGIVTDAVYKGLTGKSWAQGVRDMFPEGPKQISDETKEMLADMTNPGGWLSFAMAKQIGSGINQILNKTFKPKYIAINEDYTNRLLKLLKSEKEIPLKTTKYDNYVDSFKTYLKDFGVDLSKFTNKDLARLMALREKSVLGALPNEKAITVKVATSPKDNVYYGLNLYNSEGKILGEMDLTGKLNKSLNVEGIYSDNLEKGISYPLYDAGIRLADGNGIISGNNLLSAEQTYAVWNKYPNKTVISHKGEHNFNFGRNVNKTGAHTIIYDGPVVKLETPIGEELPMKSVTFFNPDMIDPKTGKLNPPDWSSKDIFRATIPFSLPFLLNQNDQK